MSAHEPQHPTGAAPSDRRNDTSGERRREARRVFTSRCHVTISSPAWAITRTPLAGRAININNCGVKVGSIPIEPGQTSAWSDAIADDVDLQVEVSFDDQTGLPRLLGRLVWIYPEEQTREGTICSFGILLSVMKEADSRALAAFVEQLPERF